VFGTSLASRFCERLSQRFANLRHPDPTKL
jgi:hypothetical protein